MPTITLTSLNNPPSFHPSPSLLLLPRRPAPPKKPLAAARTDGYGWKMGSLTSTADLSCALWFSRSTNSTTLGRPGSTTPRPWPVLPLELSSPAALAAAAASTWGKHVSGRLGLRLQSHGSWCRCVGWVSMSIFSSTPTRIMLQASKWKAVIIERRAYHARTELDWGMADDAGCILPHIVLGLVLKMWGNGPLLFRPMQCRGGDRADSPLLMLI